MKFWQIAVIVITLTLLSVLALRLMPPVFDLAQETGWGAVARVPVLYLRVGVVSGRSNGYGVWRLGRTEKCLTAMPPNCSALTSATWATPGFGPELGAALLALVPAVCSRRGCGKSGVSVQATNPGRIQRRARGGGNSNGVWKPDV